jgi:VWFA-related protein
MHHKIAEVVAAARVFVTASRPDDQMFVVNFNDYISVGRTRLSGNTPDNKPDNETDSLRLTNRSQDLAAAITSMPTVGMTALYDGVNTGLNELQSGKPEKKVLIVISDGGDNASKHKLAETLQKAAESSALIYTIGIFDDEDQDKNPEALRRLATVTGGEAFFPKRLEDVVAICERIAREIRTQYTLGYVSNVTVKPGVFRTIRLVANAAGEGKLVAHTRSGYIADGGGPPPKLRVSQ